MIKKELGMKILLKQCSGTKCTQYATKNVHQYIPQYPHSLSHILSPKCGLVFIISELHINISILFYW